MQGTPLHPFQGSPSFVHLASTATSIPIAGTTSSALASILSDSATASQDLVSLEEEGVLVNSSTGYCESKIDYNGDDGKLLIEPFDASKWYRLPERGSPFSVGYDVFSATDHFVPAGQDAFISTNIKIKPPKGYYPQVVSRSGLARKNKIRVEAGTIDPDYRGELIVILTNRGVRSSETKDGEIDKADFVIKKGDKIAQFILYAVTTPPVTLVPIGYLDNTERGAGGFGSTGV